MHHRAYYQNREGTYFFEANTDAYTRDAYAQMGYIMTDRKTVPRLNMRPRIEPESEVMREYLKHFPLVVDVSDSPVAEALIELMSDKAVWEGTATELNKAIGSIGEVNQMFQSAIAKILVANGIEVSRRKSNGRLLIRVSKGGMA